jgi:folate-binding protein YgfZ
MFHLKLDDRAVLQVKGEQAASFLQGLITNDINKLISNSQDALYALFLTPQGKIISDAFIITRPAGTFCLDVPGAQVGNLLKILQLYKLRQKVDISDISAETSVVIASQKIDAEYFTDPRNAELGWRAILTKSIDPQGIIKNYHCKRIDLRIPDFSMDLEENKFYPAELGMNEINAIDYAKGCYVGQEVTARTNYRGTVRKALYKISFSKTTSLNYGEDLIKDEKILGKMLGKIDSNGLALLRIELAEPYLHDGYVSV